MESLGLSNINYNHIQKGSRPSSKAVRTLCSAGKRWLPNPSATAEIWRNRLKMYRTQLIKTEGQMCNNTTKYTHTVKEQEHQNHRQTNTTKPTQYSYTGAEWGDPIFETKKIVSCCSNIWFSSIFVATPTLSGAMSKETFCLVLSVLLFMCGAEWIIVWKWSKEYWRVSYFRVEKVELLLTVSTLKIWHKGPSSNVMLGQNITFVVPTPAKVILMR